MRSILFLMSLALPTISLASSSIVKHAIKAFEKGEFVQAQALIDQAIAAPITQRESASVWYYRGVIYEKLMRDNAAQEAAAEFLEQALSAYRQTLALASVPSQYHSFAQINLEGLWAYYLDRGRRYYKQEAFERAIEQYNTCKAIKPEASQAYLYTGIAAHQDERYALALRNYEQYLELGGDSPAVYCGLASLTANHLKDIDKAIAILDQALLQYSLDNGLLQSQIQLCIEHDKAKEKEKLLQERMAAAPTEVIYPYYLGCLHEQLGQMQKALAYYQKASLLAPDKVEPILQQGIIHYNQGAQVLDKVIEMPEEEFQQVGAGFIKTFQEHLKQALPYFEKANKLKARDAFILEHLREIYLRLEMPVQAKKAKRRLDRINNRAL